MHFTSESRPSRQHSKRISPRRASMGSRASPAGSRSTRTVLSRPRKIACSSFWSTSRLMLQVVHGRLFGMGSSKANQWIHVLLPLLLAALCTLGDAPARSLTALAQRLGVAEADAATEVVPLEEEPAPVVAVPAVVPPSPLLPLTGRSGGSSAPKTLLNRPS